ncbi:hypothetical protein AAFX24_27985 [Vibrio mediterranei]|uniref:hypothetical protein n=1 Tax=Vibrio mediterranei TaxID=689 RepID=UPI0038CE9E8C
MGIVKTGFKRLFAPSWSYTFTGKATMPLSSTRQLLAEMKEMGAESHDKISAERFAKHIYSRNIRPRDLEQIVKEHGRKSSAYLIIVIISAMFTIINFVGNYVGSLDSFWYTFIGLTMTINSFALYLTELFRVKQILVGAFFPFIYMITSPSNILDLEGGVYHRGKMVHKAFLWTEQAYFELERLERSSLYKGET